MEILIWNYTYCMKVGLSDKNLALNLRELRVDLIRGADIDNMYDFLEPNVMEYPIIIFRGLYACGQLEILVYMNCYL